MITHTKKSSVSVAKQEARSIALTKLAGKSIEALWLTALFLIPIVFGAPEHMLFVDVPKIAMLRVLTGTIVAMWAFEWATARNASQDISSHKMGSASTVALAAGVSFMLAVAISAFVSVDREISFWGRNPGRDGYYLYNLACYFLIFLAMVSHLRKVEQVWRLFAVIVASSIVISSYGIFQHYGIDPFNQVSNDRILSSFGNPIFVGSYLIMSIMVALILALVRSNKASVRETLVWTLILSIQFTAMVFTLSRGPWLGMAAAVTAFLFLSSLFLTRRLILKSLLLIGLSGAIAFFVTVPLQSIVSAGDPTDAQNGTLERAASVYSEIGSSGLSGRVDIWRHSAEISLQRPPLSSDDRSPSALRHAFGYGPDMFLYSLPLKRGDDSPTAFTATAHNYWVNLWVENGFIGAATFTAFVLALAAVCLRFLLNGRKGRSADALDIVAICMLAMLTGRTIEQMVGIARVSDLTLFWTLAAVVLVLPLLRSRNEPIQDKKPVKKQATEIRWQGYTRYAVAISAGILVVVATWGGSLNSVRASLLATSADSVFSAGHTESGLEKITTAISLAPSTEEYYQIKNRMLSSIRPNNDKHAESIALERYAVAKQSMDARPRSYTAQASAAEAALNLFRLGDADKGAEAVAIYSRLAASLPTHEPPTNWLAQAYLVTGKPDAALTAIERFRSTNSRPPSAESLYLEGLAYKQTGEMGKAIQKLRASMSVATDPKLVSSIAEHLKAIEN